MVHVVDSPKHKDLRENTAKIETGRRWQEGLTSLQLVKQAMLSLKENERDEMLRIKELNLM